MKIAGIYVVAIGSSLITLAVALAYVAQKQAVVLGSGSTRSLPILLGLELALHLGLVGLLAPMIARAAAGLRVRPVMGDGTIWVLVVISTWIWMFIPQRIEALAKAGGGSIAFALALVILAAQSVLLGAIGERVRANSIDSASAPESSER